MPCDGVAIINLQLETSITDLVNFTGATTALASLLGDGATVTARGNGLRITLNGYSVNVSESGNIQSYDEAAARAVRTQIAVLSKAILVEVTRLKIEALSKSTLSRQYLPDGSLVLTVDL